MWQQEIQQMLSAGFSMPTVPPCLANTSWKDLVSFRSRLHVSFPRGMVADLLLERFRNSEISRGRW